MAEPEELLSAEHFEAVHQWAVEYDTTARDALRRHITEAIDEAQQTYLNVKTGPTPNPEQIKDVYLKIARVPRLLQAQARLSVQPTVAQIFDRSSAKV